MLTDNEGRYLHVPTDVLHPYNVGDKIVIRGYKWEEGNVTYQLYPIEAQRISSGNSFTTQSKAELNHLYLSYSIQYGYFMGDFVEFNGTLNMDYASYDFILDGTYTRVSIVYMGDALENGRNYTVTGYLLYIDMQTCWIIATSVERNYKYDADYCPVCGYLLSSGNH